MEIEAADVLVPDQDFQIARTWPPSWGPTIEFTSPLDNETISNNMMSNELEGRPLRPSSTGTSKGR